jgi:Tfp pilus assembly protein PilF
MTDWIERATEKVALAADALDRAATEHAGTLITEAIEILERDGTTEHPVAALIFTIAGDLAATVNDLANAKTLYTLAHTIAAATKADGSLVARPLIALGMLAEADGQPVEAAAIYRQALEALTSSAHPITEDARAEVLEALARVTT